MTMSKRSRISSANDSATRSSTPSGGRFFERNRTQVSGSFINSLSKDGVSKDTIRKIQRDNEQRHSE
jgi:predicted metal-dependent phosphotriesterase family hydrolase